MRTREKKNQNKNDEREEIPRKMKVIKEERGEKRGKNERGKLTATKVKE